MNANKGAEITLSWLVGSRAQRIVWLFEELNLSYNLQIHHRLDQGRAPPELKKQHPIGKSPIVTIQYPGASQPRVLAESAAIIEHLVDNFDGAKLVPKRYEGNEPKFGGETESWLRYRYFMHYAEGSLMPLVFTKILMNAIKEAPVPFFIKPVTGLIANKVSNEYTTAEFKSHFSFLENQLETSPDSGTFLCGKDLTAADILMGFPIEVAFQIAVDKEQYPRLAAYIGCLQATQGYKQAIKRVEEAEGTPYKLV